MLAPYAWQTEVIESYLGLSSSDYQDALRMGEVLQASPRLAELNTDYRATFLHMLADALAFSPGRGRAHSVVLLETYLGLSARDYENAVRMQDVLDTSLRLAELEANSRANFLGVLAEALAYVPGRSSDQSVILLESYLGLSSADYQSSERMQEILEASPWLAELTANNRTMFLVTLANVLRSASGRGPASSAFLLGSYLGLSSGDYRNARRMQQVLEASPRLTKLEANNRVAFLLVLADALRFGGAGEAHSAVLLESYLGLSEEDYQSGERMQQALRASPRLAELEANHGAMFLRVLADALGFVAGRGRAHSAVLLESYLGLSSGDSESPKRMREVLEPRLAELEANNRATCLQVLATALHFVPGRGCYHSAVLLESYLGLSAEDYQSAERIQEVLKWSTRLAELEVNNQVTCLQVLADALCEIPGRGSGHAVRLLEAYVTNRRGTSAVELCQSELPVKVVDSGVDSVPMYEFDNALGTDVDPLNKLGLVQCWSRAAGYQHALVLETYAAVVRFIRDQREDVLPSYDHRVAFLNEARKQWAEIQDMALRRAAHERDRFGEEGERRAVRIERNLMYWAEQFQNRLLVERLFRNPARVHGEDAVPLSGWEPWGMALLPHGAGGEDAGATQVGRYWQAGSLPHEEDDASEVYGATYLASCLEEMPLGGCVDATALAGAQGEPDEWSQEVRRRWLEPEGRERTLGDLVPPGAVWIRTLFDDQGRVCWWAWRNLDIECAKQTEDAAENDEHDEQLALLASGASEPGMQHRLELANRRFDLEVERIWAACEGRWLDPDDEITLEELGRMASDPEYRQQRLAELDQVERFI